MRYVAVAMVLLALPLAIPAQAAEDYDECRDLAANKPCLDVTVDATKGRYYVFLGWTKCPSHMPPECTARINDDHPLPTNPVVGMVYEESNKLGGLQRHHIEIGTVIYAPDRMLLV